MGTRPLIAVIAALAVVALLAFGLFANDTAQVAVGEPAPDLQLERLDGEGAGQLADYRGKWVLVNFWASWCDPCRTESPTIEAFAEEHGMDFVVIGINTEDLSEDALAFVDEFDLSWEMLRDGEGELKDEFGIVALPESFLVDPEGRIALLRRGAVDEQYLEQTIAPFFDLERAPEGS